MHREGKTGPHAMMGVWSPKLSFIPPLGPAAQDEYCTPANAVLDRNLYIEGSMRARDPPSGRTSYKDPRPPSLTSETKRPTRSLCHARGTNYQGPDAWVESSGILPCCSPAALNAIAW
ncbi:hypothetical protein BS47DRAFT_1365378 [Hydnum rufescens UP504]|uniref:Uncharacterized protein n=1 Tax=Hydnum rufescens UP504 TaxID=1448309 RepID=A0A9P6AQW7_9AGAM|nr:hypothetical protein BS47DRAFT_1365378 [Hydnum rufescens UP504]